MTSLSLCVGILGNVVSILVFLSPVATFRRVVKKRSTESFKGVPYITTLLSTSLWAYYGLLKPNGLLVVTVNGAGVVLQGIYVIIYIIFSPKETKIKMLKMAVILNVALYGTMVTTTFFLIRASPRLVVVGVFCACLTVGMYASPMVAMRTVVRTKSVEYMPFSLSFFLFLNGAIWSVYSLLVSDFFIGVPNALGFILGIAQLSLYWYYYKKKPEEGGEVNPDEETDPSELFQCIEIQAYIDELARDRSRCSSHQRSLHKGSSLPMLTTTSVAPQQSLGGLAKSHSTPYELFSILQHPPVARGD